MKNSIDTAIFVTTAFAAGGALAHPQFQSAEPPAGQESVAPKEIRILFKEGIIPQFSGIELKDGAGKTITTGKAMVDPDNRKVMTVPLSHRLSPGEYKVEWHAVSDDTHKVEGSYSFGVSR